MSYALDTNILVAALDSTDIFHARRKPLWLKLKAEQLHVYASSIVLAEVAGVLMRRLRNPDLVRQVYRELFHFPAITWLDITRETIAPICELATLAGLSGSDASVAYIAELYEMPLVTLDAGIKKRTESFIQVIEPEAVIVVDE